MRKTLYLEREHDDWVSGEMKKSGRSYPAVIRRLLEKEIEKDEVLNNILPANSDRLR
jgi:hypothetical protein